MVQMVWWTISRGVRARGASTIQGTHAASAGPGALHADVHDRGGSARSRIRQRVRAQRQRAPALPGWPGHECCLRRLLPQPCHNDMFGISPRCEADMRSQMDYTDFLGVTNELRTY